MAGLVESVRSAVAERCLATRCRARGCSVSMKDAPQPNALVNMDCRDLGIKDDASKCDFMFVSDDGDWIVALELKSGSVRASEVVAQLRAGARFADRIIPRNVRARFLPIAVYGGKLHRDELNKFRQSANQINFRGKRVSVELLRCGRGIVQKLR